MLTALWARFGAWISALVALVAVVLAALSVGRSKGKSTAEVKAANMRAADREAIAVREVVEQRETSKREVETIKRANDVKTENSTVSDTDVVDKLRDEWSRD